MRVRIEEQKEILSHRLKENFERKVATWILSTIINCGNNTTGNRGVIQRYIE